MYTQRGNKFNYTRIKLNFAKWQAIAGFGCYVNNLQNDNIDVSNLNGK